MIKPFLQIKTYWEKWKKTAEKVGDFQFSVIFTILYYVFVVPFGWVSNIFADFLKLKGFPQWQKVDRNFGSIKSLREQ